jgi:hypothetical protein
MDERLVLPIQRGGSKNRWIGGRKFSHNDYDIAQELSSPARGESQSCLDGLPTIRGRQVRQCSAAGTSAPPVLSPSSRPAGSSRTRGRSDRPGQARHRLEDGPQRQAPPTRAPGREGPSGGAPGLGPGGRVCQPARLQPPGRAREKEQGGREPATDNHEAIRSALTGDYELLALYRQRILDGCLTIGVRIDIRHKH